MGLIKIILQSLSLSGKKPVNQSVFGICPWVLVTLGSIAFLLLLHIAIKYSFWWMNDVREAWKLANGK
jgi:hypothetical protein